MNLGHVTKSRGLENLYPIPGRFESLGAPLGSWSLCMASAPRRLSSNQPATSLDESFVRSYRLESLHAAKDVLAATGRRRLDGLTTSEPDRAVVVSER